MSDLNWAKLRQALLAGYDELLRRLTDDLGSRELAQDALHDTWLRIERKGELSAVHNPRAFVMRMARNSASNRRRKEGRLISSAEGAELLDAIDPDPGPEQVAAARSDIERLRVALRELPSRRRDIFVAAWQEGLSRQDIADRFDLSVRMVKYEIRLARQHCAERLGYDGADILHFSSRRLSSSRGMPGLHGTRDAESED